MECYEEFQMREGESEGVDSDTRSKLKSCFTALYWATMVYMLAALFSMKTDMCQLVQAGAHLVMGVYCIRVGRYDRKNADLYYVAGGGYLFSALIVAAFWCLKNVFHLSATAGLVATVISIVGIIAVFIGSICEVVAYARTMEEIDYTLSRKWKLFLKLYLILLGGAVVFGVLMLFAIEQTVLLWIIFIPLVILALVVAFMKPAYLSKTSMML